MTSLMNNKKEFDIQETEDKIYRIIPRRGESSKLNIGFPTPKETKEWMKSGYQIVPEYDNEKSLEGTIVHYWAIKR
jgi:hypothetical protein